MKKSMTMGGRPMALTIPEERALIEYLSNVENSAFAVTESVIRNYASYIRSIRIKGPKTKLSQAWVRGFKKRHPELQCNIPKTKEIQRASAETDIKRLDGWFDKYEAILKSYNIIQRNNWNFDESPLQIGWVSGNVRLFSIRKKHNTRAIAFQPGNKESLTSIDSINAAEIDEEVVLTHTETGFNNAQRGVQWLQHFNRHSFAKSSDFDGFTIKEWFGYPPEISLATWSQKYAYLASKKSRKNSPVTRLLVMDGFSAHEDIQFIWYCIMFDIVPFLLPSHTRWLMWARRAQASQPSKLDPAPARVAFLCLFANLKAAQAVVLSRARHQKGLSRDASKVSKQPLSLRNAEARHHGITAPLTAGRPRILTDEEEEAIVAFVMWMERSGLPACKGEVEDAANTLRLRRNPDAQPVLSPADRETCTVIGTGNAIGDTIPPWLIFKSFPTLEWAYIDGDPNMRFAQSESAFSNGDITLEWAMEFNRHSWGKSATVQDRQLSFEEYFGCDEHLRKPLEHHISFDMPPKERTPAEKTWPLLIIDGFTGHGAFAFREYCIKFDILVAFLLPHSTHKLQPMDVGALRQGNLSFNRRDFAGAFMEIFNEGFTRAHIISGFEKSGIFPPTDQPAVSYLLQKQLKSKQAVDPAYASLLPPEGRFSAASDTAKHVGERYHDILSSPTRAGLKNIRNIVNEAMLLEDTIKRYADDRRSRIEKQYNKRK
ncbi:hypothetical protein FPOA_12112 [Fusarium poae]|uniref:HTH CENPB-type domain-containing protein n=2 Tax=Fusarium poae TaxID=36050 RepID=A0A1B8AAH8_FUSPO|nr:hypothetical protein FPOA_12112 [Fusarium poae]